MTPEVGMPATIMMGDDEIPITITSVKPRSFTFKYNDCRLENGRFSGQPDALRIEEHLDVRLWVGTQRWTILGVVGPDYHAVEEGGEWFTLGSQSHRIELGKHAKYFNFNLIIRRTAYKSPPRPPRRHR